MLIEDERLYTLTEVADMTGYSTKTIRRRMETGRLNRVTAKREKVKFFGKEIKKWLQEK